MLNRIIRYFLENRVVTLLLLVLIIVWGISTSPFNWHGGIIPRNPIPVDALSILAIIILSNFLYSIMFPP